MNNQYFTRQNGGIISRISFLYPLFALIGLYQFTTSFFLAKKSMSHISLCQNDTASQLLIDEIGLSESNIEFLQKSGILSTFSQSHNDDNGGRISSNGCWMPRRADAMAIIVVDALRFDFALQHLPKSIGSRLTYEAKNNYEQSSSTMIDYDRRKQQQQQQQQKQQQKQKQKQPRGQSQLFKFVADPPTVTMQRLKGLTTGGLPTFADISGSFGGANVDEDSWVQQLHDVPVSRRGIKTSMNNLDGNERKIQMGFVGDDTWIDLFPYQFDDSHPYPSFNTRDLDTVDNGCLEHLPRLLRSFGSQRKRDEKYFEVIVSHFLGVDHVGHTYGPNNIHMDQKLNQMDDVLQTIFAKVDEAIQQCHVVFVFGDHGMTEDGNHGGGTIEEINAGLFAHFSPGCGDLGPSLDVTGSEIGSYAEEAFRSINQIDLVPTLSLLLGLPIPFANLGGAVPMLLPPLHYHSNTTDVEAPYVATALALNAAQVWNYLTTYSTTANKLPEKAVSELNELLQHASLRYKEALAHSDSFDSLAYREACGLFKHFLAQATDLGKQVWTRFDTDGMGVGIMCLFFSYILSIPFRLKKCIQGILRLIAERQLPSQLWNFGNTIEPIFIFIAIVFHCIVLTFSNSYIISEQSIIMFLLSVLCVMTWVNKSLTVIHKSIRSGKNYSIHNFLPLVVVTCSRIHQLLVTGHGQDPMIRKHWAHNTRVFITSLILLTCMRICYFSITASHIFIAKTHTILDVLTLAMLGFSWVEKRSLEISRHGYLTSRIAMILSAIGFFMLIAQWLNERISTKVHYRMSSMYLHKTLLIVIKLLLFIVTVTGPSTATSCLFLICQFWSLSTLTFMRGNEKRGAALLAALWRLSIRHAFYVTGHACSFNRLHFSAAFVAAETFHYYTAGVSLFLNTFGIDLLGIILVACISKESGRSDVWSYFCFYQLSETIFSCISVTLMRRHLMVWAIFAPRFVFAAIFLMLCMAYHLFDKSITVGRIKFITMRGSVMKDKV